MYVVESVIYCRTQIFAPKNAIPVLVMRPGKHVLLSLTPTAEAGLGYVLCQADLFCLIGIQMRFAALSAWAGEPMSRGLDSDSL